MAAFIAIAVVLTLLVLGGVLWPLWRDSRRLAAGALLALGVGAFALYRLLGTPQALQPQPPTQTALLDQAITRLKAELQRNPGSAEGWRLLGRSLAAREDFAEASQAYTRALQLQADDPDLLVEAAQARMRANTQRALDQEAVQLLRHALELQPAHQRARWFLGVAQRQAGQAAEAAATWEPLLAQVEAATAASLRTQIDAARTEAGLPPLPAADASPAVATTPGLTVKVALDPDFAARVRLRGDTRVFVIARIPGGPPMPVAVEKHALQELPLTVTLDDGDSPMPTQKLSALKEVEVFARLSASGNAMRQEGDLDSAPVRVTLPAAAPVDIVLCGGGSCAGSK